MGKVFVDDLKPGMVLESELKGANGRSLLPAGATIEEKHLRIIKIWGVTEAEIVGAGSQKGEGPGLSDIPIEVLRASQERVKGLFRLNDLDRPPVRDLYDLCVMRTARAMISGTLQTARLPVEEDEAPLDTGGFPDLPSPYNLVQGRTSLVSLPDIYFRIVEVLDNPRTSAFHIAEVVSKDPSLTAKLLRLVNSPFYGFPSKIDSISRAVALVGAQELSTLALGISVINSFQGIPPELVDMKAFWEHSIACGVLARVLSDYKPGLSGERFFVAGLLHDVGKLFMLQRIPKPMLRVLSVSEKEGRPNHLVEEAVVGYDHTEVAGFLFNEWKLPPTLRNMVRHHHKPDAGKNPIDSAIIHLADILAIALGIGNSGTRVVPAVSETAWASAGFAPSVLGPAVKQALRQLDEINKAFLGEGK
ncbi:MAG: HDOD domain-containing protein [Desulfovibrionaceae bacterium]|nr:HDOD domain-containing protein [Desulfovibrionaceae bacterium]